MSPPCSCPLLLAAQMMVLEPDKRIDPDTALKHPFVRDALPKRKEHKGGGRANS